MLDKVTIGDIRDIWAGILDWIRGESTSKPKIQTETLGKNKKIAVRKNITPSQEELFDLEEECDIIDVANYGPGSIYVDIDSEAEINGEDDILIIQGMGYKFNLKGTVVHVISTEESLVQVIGLR
jgi:ATP-dependent phosphoenolpyruvate carboxykinase